MSRRRGKEDSASRFALMDAVETVMLQEGYAALSVRSIARCVQLNYQLIFYYFESLDGLLLATYKRRTQRTLELLKIALGQDRPLHALWEAASNPDGAALSLEYMAMSNHKPAIRAETITHVEETSRLVSAMMAGRLVHNAPAREGFTSTSIAMIIAMLGTNIGLQMAQGIEGQSLEDTQSLIKTWIDLLEPS